MAGLGTVVHDTLVHDCLHDELIGHVSRESTAIIGQEEAVKKVQSVKFLRKRGRPAKDERHGSTCKGWKSM
jgi:hypothetical protein